MNNLVLQHRGKHNPKFLLVVHLNIMPYVDQTFTETILYQSTLRDSWSHLESPSSIKINLTLHRDTYMCSINILKSWIHFWSYNSFWHKLNFENVHFFLLVPYVNDFPNPDHLHFFNLFIVHGSYYCFHFLFF